MIFVTMSDSERNERLEADRERIRVRLDHETSEQSSHRQNNNRLPNNSNKADRRSDSAGTGFARRYNYILTPPRFELKIRKEFSDTMRTQFEGEEISGKLRYFTIYTVTSWKCYWQFTVLLLLFQ